MIPRGITVLESVLAMSLGLLLTWAGMRAYALSQASLRQAAERAGRVQEASQLLWRLAQERRGAGFAGCARLRSPPGQGLDWRYGVGAHPVRSVRVEYGRLAALSVDAGAADSLPPGSTALIASCTRVDAVVVGQELLLTRRGGSLRLELLPDVRPVQDEGGHPVTSLELHRLETRRYRVDASRRDLLDQRGERVLDRVAALTLTPAGAGLDRLRLTLDDGMELGLDVARLVRAP